jgi:RNA polymerase-binding transcription factor DksA
MNARKQRHRSVKPKATTADVVGSTVPARRNVPQRWRAHFDRLLELRSALMKNRSDLAQDAREEQPSYSLHMADAGTDSYDRDFALSQLSSEQDAVYAIDQALNRIRNGTYGICELTGKRIEPQRLEAIPWTRFSAEAEKRLEREGGFKRTHLGSRNTVTQSRSSENSEETEPHPASSES